MTTVVNQIRTAFTHLTLSLGCAMGIQVHLNVLYSHGLWGKELKSHTEKHECKKIKLKNEVLLAETKLIFLILYFSMCDDHIGPNHNEQ